MPPLSVTIPSTCLSKQRARKGYRGLPASSSNRIVFALIITINVSCTGSRRQKACVFAMPLPRIGVVEFTNAPYPKHAQALLRILLLLPLSNQPSILLKEMRLCVKFDQFLPVRSHFDTKHPVNFFHIATFPSPTFGPLFAFHCPLFFYEKQ